MSFLERAIRNGIRKGVSDAIGNALQKAVEPAATELANKAESYATEAAKNIKVCPSCGEGATADKKFCPKCGTKLPEQTVAQGAVCPNCGKQNTVGTKFCTDCGTKLIATVQAEQVKAKGFTIDAVTTDEEMMGMVVYEFEAQNADGYTVTVAFTSGISSVIIEKP